MVASLVGVAAAVALLTPASALAGTYSWGLPGDFSGANPEVKYGQPSWSYVGAVTDGSGAITMTAAAGQSASIVWTSPFTSSQSVTVTSTGFGGSGLGCLLGGVSVPSGTMTVSPGQTLTATVSAGPLGTCSASGTISISAATPSVAITNPNNGAAITNGIPTLSGTASTAFDASSTVSLSIYSGPSASGTPVQTLSGSVGLDGSYSVTPAALANGKYTAVAQQNDPAGSLNTSSPVTFTVANPSSTVSLASLGSAPLTDSQPTLKGTAGTRAIDSKQVTVLIYAGNGTNSSPIRQLTDSLDSNGNFAVNVTPGLGDGQYTALARQDSSAGLAFSHTLNFQIKVHPPALTFAHPAGGVTLNDVKPTFSGQAGDALGDSSTVTLHLYHGQDASGRSAGVVHIKAGGSSWSDQWPQRLAYGWYTAVAVQTDDAGHTSRSDPHTFRVAPTPKLIGSKAQLSRSGVASVSVGCLAGPGATCAGTVLIVTRHSYRATAGGPTGQLEVLFARVQITGGGTSVIHRSVGPSVLHVLLRHRRVPVVVTVKLSGTAGGPMKATADRVLELRR
jgi:hypothetical protein